MEKKLIAAVGIILCTIGIWFFTAQPSNTHANERLELDVELAMQAGFVIVENGEINNILSLWDFMENMARGQNDSVTILENPGTRHVNALELHFTDGVLYLYYDFEVAPGGRREYKIRVYDQIVREFHNGDVVYFLEGARGRDPLLSYSLD